MSFYVLVLVLAINGQIGTMIYSNDGVNPVLYKSKAECEAELKKADEFLKPQAAEQGAVYELNCITAEQMNKMLGKEPV